MGKYYENYISINFKNREKIKYDYFFYGREIEKKIKNSVGNKEQIRIISDGNLFEKMLINTNVNLL